MEHENSVKSEVDLESDSEPKLEIGKLKYKLTYF